MPAQVTNYKCPTCTGPLHFVGASGKLECDYCGASYDVAQIEALSTRRRRARLRQRSSPPRKRPQCRGEASADGGDWDTSGFSEDWGEGGTYEGIQLPQLRRGAHLRRQTRRPPPVPTAAIPPWCRGSFPGS